MWPEVKNRDMLREKTVSACLLLFITLRHAQKTTGKNIIVWAIFGRSMVEVNAPWSEYAEVAASAGPSSKPSSLKKRKKKKEAHMNPEMEIRSWNCGAVNERRTLKIDHGLPSPRAAKGIPSPALGFHKGSSPSVMKSFSWKKYGILYWEDVLGSGVGVTAGVLPENPYG